MEKVMNITLDKNEQKIIPFIFLDNNNVHITVNSFLNGEGSSLTLIGLFFGEGRREIIFNTNVIHNAKNTKSLTMIKSVFKDKSSFSSDGLITINKGAVSSDGYFSSKVLLFDDARGRSVPSLEILENDLKAGHSSTVGQPDPLQIFYLNSRGISTREAENLIVLGFFKSVLPLLSKEDQEIILKKFGETN